MPVDVGALAQAGSAVLDTGLNMFWSGQLAKQQHDFSTEMYRIQREDALKDWNRQNAYNSPSQQMQRLQDAGLNPNLVYGRGADATSGPIRASTPGSVNPPMPKLQLGEALRGYYDVQLQKAQIDNVRAQNEVIHEEAKLKRMQNIQVGASTSKLGVDTETGQFNLDVAKSLKNTSIESAQVNLQKQYADLNFTLSENERKAAMNAADLRTAAQTVLNMRLAGAKTAEEIKQVQQAIVNLKSDNSIKQFEIELNKSGNTKSDSWWQRVLGMILQKAMGNSNPLP